MTLVQDKVFRGKKKRIGSGYIYKAALIFYTQEKPQELGQNKLFYSSSRRIPNSNGQVVIKILKLQPRAGDLIGAVLELMLDGSMSHSLLDLTEVTFR